MRFICIISLLLTTITILYAAPAPQALTPEQELTIDSLAWLYAQFTLTFDADHLPLDNLYLRTDGQQHFEQFEEVEDFFSIRNLDQYFFQSSEIHVHQWTPVFETQIKFYQSTIINEDSTPLPFETFYTFFGAIKNEFSHNIINGIVRGRMINKHVLKNFCNTDVKKVQEALNKFEIYGRFPPKSAKKLETKEKKFNIFNGI